MTGSIERKAQRRARYLEANTDLSDTECMALAHSELGASSSGIAKEIGTTQGTARQYLSRIIARFGPAAAEVRIHFDVERDLEPVTVADLSNWPGASPYWDTVEEDPDPGPGVVWREHATRHPDVVPGPVCEEADIDPDDDDDGERDDDQQSLGGGQL
jgi:DNA-binding CsgD family transcriptional regulator